MPFDNPFREIFSSAAGAGDADGVEAGGDKEVSQLGGFAQDEVVVGREAFGAVDEFREPAGFQRRNAPAAILERFREFVPIGSRS